MCVNESSGLLGRSHDNNSNSHDSHSNNRRWMDRSIGFVVCALLVAVGAVVMGQSNSAEERPAVAIDVDSNNNNSSLRSSIPNNNNNINNNNKPEKEGILYHTSNSQYKTFQAMGFQIYTGGAPALLDNDNLRNPECEGYASMGYFDDYDATSNASTANHFWQCYLGHSSPKLDVEHRLQIMTDAVEKAYQQVRLHKQDGPEVLKIFIAPEFYWRGREGAYVFQEEPKQQQPKSSSSRHHNKTRVRDDDCTEVCHIMKGLEKLVAHKKYQDWLFLFGTIVVSETLPQEDPYDDLFYNFAPVYKGYDPDAQDHRGKRFLVPKRYVSNVDFLTPTRQYTGNMTQEIVDLTQQQKQRQNDVDDSTDKSSDRSSDKSSDKSSDNDEELVVVNNPFELQRDFYDRDMWYNYKEELEDLGYTMIEYDWLILDNITFTIEVCLDHGAGTAVNAFLADNVMGSPTRIPKSVAHWDEQTKKYLGSIEQVPIPRHQAQLSLVSSMGMVANPQALALADNGTLILQDGQSDANGTMAWAADCDTKSWHFEGGTEFITRTASFTSTRIEFKYEVHGPQRQVGIYDDLYNDDDNAWKGAIQGVFTTTKYEPKITMYPVRDLAKV